MVGGEAGLHTHHNHNLEGNTGCGFASMRLSPQPSETFFPPSFLYNNNRLHGGPQTTNISSRSAGGRVSEFQEHSTLSLRSAHFEKHPLNTFKLGVGVSKQLMILWGRTLHSLSWPSWSWTCLFLLESPSFKARGLPVTRSHVKLQKNILSSGNARSSCIPWIKLWQWEASCFANTTAATSAACCVQAPLACLLQVARVTPKQDKQAVLIGLSAVQEVDE